MPITKDQLAQLNFGYLNGSDLMQFAPFGVLGSQYDKFSEFFQTGCEQAYEEIKSKLSNRYDIDKELSNANQKVKNVTGAQTLSITAGSYISRIILTWNDPLPILNNSSEIVLSSPIVSSNIDNSPVVQIGTTLNGTDIMSSDNIQFSKVLWVNKYFSTATTLYFAISDGNIDIDMACNSGIKDPVITVKEYLNQNANFTLVIPANTYIYQIFATKLLSTPTINIGTTLGGSQVCALTTINNAVLTLLIQYFAAQTTLYFTILSGSTDLRFDIGYNFIAPTPTLNPYRNAMLVKIVSILAIKNILGSVSGENKMLQGLYEWAYDTILEIRERQASLTLEAAPTPLASKAYTIQSSFKTLG